MGNVKELTRHPAGSSLIVRLGIVAHDAKKDELGVFARAHRRALQSMRLIAPEDTARTLAEAGIEAQSLARDTHGGDLQLAAAIVDGMIDAVIFLEDPMLSLAGEPDLRTLLKICDLERIPLATNIASAEIVVRHLAGVRSVLETIESEPSPALGGVRVLRPGGPPRAGGSARRRMRW